MAATIKWFNHASFRLSAGLPGSAVVYIDPWKIADSPKDGTVVLISHSHYDHLSLEDIERVLGPDGAVFGPADVTARVSTCRTLTPGQTVQIGADRIGAVAAYNVDKKFHPRVNNWLGYVVELAGTRIYYAGDTDLTEEMGHLGRINVALLPAGGTYTMDPQAAADAVARIKPDLAVPYHWGDIVGQRADADAFVKLIAPRGRVLEPGQSVTV
jgi:L-ascorbate metabolism protein UlaG (beta-lactamase superfamily)